MKITDIIFDLGNVVLTNDWYHDCPEKNADFSKYFNISEKDMKKGWESQWPVYRVGKISEEGFWSGFLKVAGSKVVDVDKAKQIWRKNQSSLENMLNLLNRLKANYSLAALANVGKEWLDFKREKFHLDLYFKIIIGSGIVGYAKPGNKIYQLILQRLNTDPRECLFIDDHEKNLPPAKKIGMETILFSGQSKLEKELRKLKIKC